MSNLNNPYVNPLTIVNQTADVTVNNSAVLVDITGLTTSVLANTRYLIILFLNAIRAGGGAQNSKFAPSMPAASTIYKIAPSTSFNSLSDFSSGMAQAMEASPGKGLVMGVLLNVGATAGTFKMQFTQSAAEAVDHTCYGCSMLIWKQS